MGWWARRLRLKYTWEASRELDKIQYRCGRTDADRKRNVVGPAVATRIRVIYRQGGEENFRAALALWQLGNAIYPEHVTEEHYPKLVNHLCCEPLSSVLRSPQ